MEEVSREEGLRRLEVLADYIEQLPLVDAVVVESSGRLEDYRTPRLFDMRTFGDHIGDEPPTDDGPYCGMRACLGGWAATIPEFRALGLRLVWHAAVNAPPDAQLADVVFGDGIGERRNFAAVQSFFALTGKESDSLFNGPRQWTRLEGVKAIREFVARKRRLNVS